MVVTHCGHTRPAAISHPLWLMSSNPCQHGSFSVLSQEQDMTGSVAEITNLCHSGISSFSHMRSHRTQRMPASVMAAAIAWGERILSWWFTVMVVR